MRGSWVVGGVIVLACASAACAIVVEVPIAEPDDSWVGRFTYGNPSGVAIGEYWVLTAEHNNIQNGDPSDTFKMDGIDYEIDSVYPSEELDLTIVKHADPLPGWHEMTDAPDIDDPVLMAGCGQGMGDEAGTCAGFLWANPHLERWATNNLEWIGGPIVYTVYDNNITSTSLTEGGGALHDSGGGFFVMDGEGDVLLFGIIQAAAPPTCDGTQTGASYLYYNIGGVYPILDWIEDTIANN